jgi:hypothetical protein
MRDQFTFDSLLPTDLADALELIQQPLPTDPLSAAGTLLCGYSGLLKLGSRLESDYRFSVPINMYWANVGVSGLAKTPIKQKLIDDPAAAIRRLHKTNHELAVENWRMQCEGLKGKDKPPKPRPRLPHAGGDYSPEALGIQLEVHEADGLGLLLIRDEISGLLRTLDNDKRSGRGTGEAQFLELFDGGGGTSLRVEEARQYEQSHVSLYGNIQPEVLRRHINGDDATGKWARILFNQLPVQPLDLQYDDPSEEEKSAYRKSQEVLADYAMKVHARDAMTIELSPEARRLVVEWFNAHQLKALAPTTPQVISALLGKSSAQAHRIAGILHLVHNIQKSSPEAKVTAKHMKTAMDIVDTLITETCLFHKGPADPKTELMRKVHEASWNNGAPKGINWQDAKEKLCTTKKLREIGASGFFAAIEEWAEGGFGEIDQSGKSVAYTAIKALPQ